jgi:hypothetical protein
VLHNVIGDAEVMAGQLGHLLTVGELPAVSLGILPMGIYSRWPVEDFWIFDDKQVNVELISGFLTITQPSEVAMYADAFARLAELAVVGVAARKLITAAIDLWNSRASSCNVVVAGMPVTIRSCMTSAGAIRGLGVEWAGAGADESHPERDSRGWPILHAANEACDGRHPLTGRACDRSYHKGFHQAADGTEW